ncbi:sulfite exporter TauE/SafE family protein [Actinomadura sp. NAK00032]|uniref:sulfite exporter TauE/SafE family protein n=1 Tax=Actinomadura sp. NAK00032 TaxID=2742128 RepID=UPI0015929ADF|nr:sulfite exporter TauE/SafE family protein [Actinomadura sp. NAK00032]QKW36361.1 sulfite exporter TauE/SafE family protein [Actinomadura sp. NAK00032]
MAGLEPVVAAALVLLGLAAGVGITAVGPGGVLITVGLFAFTDLTPAQVAGTAIVTNVATGLAGTAVYTRSGQLRDPATRRTAVLLAAGAVAGTPLGVAANGLVEGRVFGVLLGAFVALTAVLVLWRRPGRAADDAPAPAAAGIGAPTAVAVGIAVAAVGAMFGVGGPLLSVPLLVALGTPVLSALAAAQAQSVVIAGIGTAGYLAAGAVDWRLAALMGVPELAGVLAGWMIARAVPAAALKAALVVCLLVLAPYVALHG